MTDPSSLVLYVRSQKDPAVERWFQMREDMYKGFTFTRENTVPVLSLVFVVPAVIYYFFDSDLVRPLLPETILEPRFYKGNVWLTIALGLCWVLGEHRRGAGTSG